MSEYWQKRFEILENQRNNVAKQTIKSITPAFDQAQAQIEKEINAWYGRFAKNNEISLAEAKKLLNTRELKEFRWDVEEYIKYGRQNAMNQAWMKQLENASARFHISRLEALKIRTQNSAERAFGNELDQINEMAAQMYTIDYYHTAYEIQKGLGIGWDVGQIDERKLDSILSKPWTTDKQTFSDRIWKSKTQLLDSLHTELTQMCILGKSPDQVINNIANRINVSKGQAGRLVMTEAAYFGSVAQKDCFNDLGVEQYEIVGTLDISACDICGNMDGKAFDMKDFQAGVTAPPFHPRCRCFTAPYFDDEDGAGERYARDVETGEGYMLPKDTTYQQWKAMQDEKYGAGTVDNKRKKWYNESADKKQFEAYKALLGDDAPKTFADFKNAKYGDGYSTLKVRYADTRIQDRIKTGKTTTAVLAGRQGKHILGHNNYIEGRSYLNSNEDVQALVNKYAGTGTLMRDASGKWEHKEVVTADHPIGFAVSQVDGSATETSTFTIHYSKKGVHIVPKKE